MEFIVGCCLFKPCTGRGPGEGLVVEGLVVALCA